MLTYVRPARLMPRFGRNSSTWSSVLLRAVGVVSQESKYHSDLLATLSEEMENLRSQLVQWTNSEPLLDTVIQPYTTSHARFFHPLLVLLMSRASTLDATPSKQQYQRYKQLSRITELIHAANAIHKSVQEHAKEAHSITKLKVLVGDYLLGKASVDLASLKDNSITELMASAIANLIEGNFPQTRDTMSIESERRRLRLQSAFLPAKACLCASILNRASEHISQACFEYGLHLGTAMQLRQSNPDKTEIRLDDEVNRAKKVLSVLPDVEVKQTLYEIADAIAANDG
ncbi:decaprenyl diphosphate synthase subunit 2 Dlp1 [Schizosaccharomyces japonicus yFS275]|uniref:Decaprenyl diphosphate synthase subunit 2 Dlp1 n=1 Tax=Schizosaccharomyces japonicus (strain yFS275 / FY16936) TaxID=402676 RepID=B6JZ41_SCHJY|nr:decaprenyl diphosphate synthase subunit 2 Dlp1 [Schizosaccharomyces japonicus yFS275]EEB06809.1 decaprenyl diphosphate synthase subunit 2 Dlp1 [Schizosaccharomyces japonicus yFS275]